MELYILDRQYKQIDVIDDFKSMLWVKRYSDFGDCEIYISATERLIGVLQRGYYIRRDDDDMICRIKSSQIETSEEDGNYLIVKGVDCRDILNQRVIWKTSKFKGTAERFIRNLITANIINPEINARRIENMKLGAEIGLAESINLQTSYENLGEKVIEICKQFNYGSRMEFDGTDFIFSLYKGVDRSYAQEENPYVVFSPAYENLSTSTYSVDESDYRTIALVGGNGEGSKRRFFTTAISEKKGIDRYEMFVDADSISNELTYEELREQYPTGTKSGTSYMVDGKKVAELDDATDPQSGILVDSEYFKILDAKGHEELAKHLVITSFEGEVEPYQSYKYGIDYFLGDIVTVQNEYGIEAFARIVEVIESYDDNGHAIIPTFEYTEV